MRYYHVREKDDDDVPAAVTARTAPDPILATAISVAAELGYHVTVSDDTLDLRWPVQQALLIPLASLRDATTVPAGGPDDDQEGWDDLFSTISGYVGGFTSTAEGTGGAVRLANFAAVRPLLRVNLEIQNSVDTDGRPVAAYTPHHVVARRLGTPAVNEVVFVDTPAFAVPVPVPMLSVWSITADELFEIGRDNTRAEPPPVVDRQRVDGIVFIRLSGNRAYLNAHALWAGDYVPERPHGVLVAFSGGQVYLHRLGADVDAALDALARTTDVGTLYWWHNGELAAAAAVRPPGSTVELTPDFAAAVENARR